MRICNKCEISKPLTEFYKACGYTCKQCRREYQQAHYRKYHDLRVGKGGGSAKRYSENDLSNAREWNLKHPFKRTLSEIEITFLISTGRMAVV
jgi:hypothetical protein